MLTEHNWAKNSPGIEAVLEHSRDTPRFSLYVESGGKLTIHARHVCNHEWRTTKSDELSANVSISYISWWVGSSALFHPTANTHHTPEGFDSILKRPMSDNLSHLNTICQPLRRKTRLKTRNNIKDIWFDRNTKTRQSSFIADIPNNPDHLIVQQPHRR